MQTSGDILICKVCGSHHTVKDGMVKNVQRWKCKTCGRKFLDNGAMFGLKTPAIQVMSGLSLYYKGVSFGAIRKNLQKDFHNCPSASTIYRWTHRAPRNIMNAVKYYHPDVSDTWIVDENALTISGKQVLIQDVIDKDSSFLLASQISLKHNNKDIELLMEDAIKKAAKFPRAVISPVLAESLRKLNLPTHASFGYRKNAFTIQEQSSPEYERIHAMFLERAGVMAVLKSVERAVEFTNGWLVQHNYFDPQEYMDGQTPAEAVGYHLKYR